MYLKLQRVSRVLLASSAGDVSRTFSEVSSLMDDKKRASVVAVGAACGSGGGGEGDLDSLLLLRVGRCSSVGYSD